NSGNIPDSVLSKIRRSDALIGFTTRRASQDNTIWQTHQWVTMELAAAITLRKKVIEVRERGVDPQEGLLSGKQRIEYDENARDKCLVEIVKALGDWHHTETVSIKLLPAGVYDDLQPLLDDQGLACRYLIKIGNFEDGPFEAKIQRIKGGLFIDPPNVPKDALIQIIITHGNRRWTSDYESID